MEKIHPDYWTQFIIENDLIETEIDIPESSDLSEVGASFEIFDEKNSIDESENFYPGIAVKAEGFIPIGGCTIGTGDPYFINIHEGKNGALYRIYHNSVSEDGYNKEDAIDTVLGSFTEILKYIL